MSLSKTVRRKVSSPRKQKLLLTLVSGLALSLNRSPKQSWKIIGQIPKEWQRIDRQYLYRTLKEFKEERLISFRELTDGKTEIIITESGKEAVLRYDVDQMELNIPKHWDKIWRLVFFDIPEKEHYRRSQFRDKIKELGFIELQHSIWVNPYPCKKEIDFLVEFFEIRKYTRFAEAINLTNEADLRLKFGV
jgi:DNA-binding PadR family transcriptional regulator